MSQITKEQFDRYHSLVHEDFLDQHDCNVYILGGWLMHKYPKYSLDILKTLNEVHPSAVEFQDIDIYVDNPDLRYIDFAEFCNHTEHLRNRVNKILMETFDEHTGL